MPRPRFETLEPARRAAILAAAVEEIGAHGVAKASINRIIARSDLSKGAFYYYFDDKADLCLAAIRDAIERTVAAIGSPAPFRDAHGFWDSLGEVYARGVAFVVAEPELAALLRTLLQQPAPGMDAALAQLTEELVGFMADFLARGVEVGAVRADLPPGLLARVLAAMGDASDRWVLAHWDELGEAGLARYPREILELHMRVAAPLSLLNERARREGVSP